MDETSIAKYIWDFHRAHGRDTENPPHRLARETRGAHWAEVWVTGLDTENWFYRLSDHEQEPVLIAHNRDTTSGVGLQSDEILLQAHVSKRMLTAHEWTHYLRGWLETSAWAEQPRDNE